MSEQQIQIQTQKKKFTKGQGFVLAGLTLLISSSAFYILRRGKEKSSLEGV
tara:strand:+ start:311 stop:463 length:153 start_codon:yes stop_codon:yes gene_type:complete